MTTEKENLEHCVFCRRDLPRDQISNEHVFLDSLSKLTSPDALARIRFQYDDPKSGLRLDTASQFTHPYQVVVRICSKCNTEVLNNAIEQKIGKRLRSMIAGEELHLNANDRLNFARWCAKTAMTRELIDVQEQNVPHAIPNDQYAMLHDYLLPPPRMHIYYGKAEYQEIPWHRHRRLFFSEERDQAVGTGHFTTLVIGHMWMFVAGFSNHEIEDYLSMSVDGLCRVGTHGTLGQLWPPSREEIDMEADIVSGQPFARMAGREFPPERKRTHLTKRPIIDAPLAMVKRVSWGPSITWSNAMEAHPLAE